MKQLLVLFLLTTSAFAQDLVINGAEFGIGKFHRKDNKVRPYEDNNAWKVFILPEKVPTTTAFVQKNSELNYTVFFTNLEEFLSKVVEITRKTGKKVGMLNLNAHGLPGGMWFPVDARTRDSFECSSWKAAANNSDDDNYDQYYSAISKEEIKSMNQMANAGQIPSYECLTGVNEWLAVVARVPGIKTAFTEDAQIHMLSCIVGLGSLGDKYTTGLAKILFDRKGNQQVQTSIKFGLGDWSMPEGMGFWGFESDAQMKRDNEIYTIHRRDFEVMQKGDIRVAQIVNGEVKSGTIYGQDYIYLTHDDRPVVFGKAAPMSLKMNRTLPASVRVPGTNVVLKLK